MNGTLVVRMYLSSLRMIKKAFPPLRQETMVSYFHRLSIYLKEHTEGTSLWTRTWSRPE